MKCSVMKGGALHNTTLHKNFLLQDRQLQAVERSRISWWWA